MKKSFVYTINRVQLVAYYSKQLNSVQIRLDHFCFFANNPVSNSVIFSGRKCFFFQRLSTNFLLTLAPSFSFVQTYTDHYNKPLCIFCVCFQSRRLSHVSSWVKRRGSFSLHVRERWTFFLVSCAQVQGSVVVESFYRSGPMLFFSIRVAARLSFPFNFPSSGSIALLASAPCMAIVVCNQKTCR